jgi:tRNA(Ile)-lysidine synthetase, N-terminal domain/tRNA(Ile)-lysidine synthetase, C-terminal domain
VFDLIDSALKTIRENNMFDKGDKVIVAVSGGPDSIALLHVLYKLKEKLDISLYVAHINHGLRGIESDTDEEYVRMFCESLNIEFISKRVDINQISKLKNISSESAGREVRYEFFEEVMKKFSAQKVAIAHNANDQAETILMRIMRGTGMDGLIGIRPVRDNIFVRPLINNTRDDIEEYCLKNNINPRIDKTNLQAIYSRNKVRLQLIPYIQENFNKDIIQVLNRLSYTIKVDNDYLEVVSKEKYKKYCDINKEKVIISKEAFLEHESIITRIIRLAIHNVVGNLYNFEKIHIYDIIRIQRCSTGKELNLPSNVYILNNYGDIVIYKNKKQNIRAKAEEYILHYGVNLIEDIRIKANVKVISMEEKLDFKSNKWIKYFDYDKIKGDITLRFRRDGDKFTPLGMNGTKKLKDLFINLKIPKEQREEIPLVCFGGNIAWITGYRVSEIFKVDENTKNILEVKVEREEF